jgi:hypothetical protein
MFGVVGSGFSAFHEKDSDAALRCESRAANCLSAFCSTQSLPPSEVLDRYLARSTKPEAGCSSILLAVHLDASIPKLGKERSMSGLKLISQTGQAIYESLRFTGDDFVKTAVIARFLAHEEKSRAGTADYAITKRNYSLDYVKTS